MRTSHEFYVVFWFLDLFAPNRRTTFLYCFFWETSFSFLFSTTHVMPPHGFLTMEATLDKTHPNQVVKVVATLPQEKRVQLINFLKENGRCLHGH